MTMLRLTFVAALALLVSGPETNPAQADQPKQAKKVVDAKTDPGDLQSYRKDVGKVFYFLVIGKDTGTVYGTGVYTDDSSLATAAVHAGVLPVGKKGMVKVTILKGKDSYRGSTQNGVTSRDWRSFEGSYQVQPAERNFVYRIANSPVQRDPGTLARFTKDIGKTFLFEVTGSTTGTVWGSGVYTTDSTLATAAVHAGVLRNGQKAVVKVSILEGKDAYPGTTKNGVTSQKWRKWLASFRVEAVKK
jgi:hypothetical protein